MMMVRAMVAALVLVVSAPAHATNTSGVTLGIGTGIGIHHAAQPGQRGAAELLASINVRAKLLWILGFDLTYRFSNSPHAQSSGDLHFGARLRATALIYVVPTKDFAIYLGAGIGGSHFGELVEVGKPSNSYHAGAGVEFHLFDHLSLDVGFFMIIPGYDSIRDHVTLSATEEVMAAVEDGSIVTDQTVPTPSVDVGEFISPGNFEVLIRAILYL